MKANLLINKTEKIKRSTPYIGYLILEYLKNRDKTNIVSLNTHLQKKLSYLSYRELVFALTFLFSLGLVDQESVYIKRRTNDFN